MVNEARMGLGIATAAGHAVVGLSSMVNVFKPKELATSWGNTAKLAIALNPTAGFDDSKVSWLFKPGEITRTRTAFVSSLVDSEDWKTDPAKALGDNIFTIATAVPTGGAGAGVKGLSKAGELSRIAEATRIGTEANDVGRFSAHSVTGGQGLQKSLATESQMTAEGRTIAGAGHRKSIRVVQELVRTHGGNPNFWAKKASWAYETWDGFTQFEVHWHENLTTGERVEEKTKCTKLFGLGEKEFKIPERRRLDSSGDK